MKIFDIDGRTLLEDEPASRTFDYAMINNPIAEFGPATIMNGLVQSAEKRVQWELAENLIVNTLHRGPVIRAQIQLRDVDCYSRKPLGYTQKTARQ